MKNVLFYSILVLFFGFSACDNIDDNVIDGGDLLLQFQAEFDGEPFYINQEYVFPDGRKVRFSKLDFFISDISVQQLQGDENVITDLSEVEFINLSGSQVNPVDPLEYQLTSLNLPVGDYNKIRFTLGLSEALNNKTPNDSDLGSSSPLKMSSHYWADWASYIFMKIEGAADFNDDGSIGGDETFGYHTGQTGFEQALSLSTDFSISKDALSTKSIILDVPAIFYDNSTERFDMTVHTAIHNANGVEVIEKIMQGAASGVKIQ